jgi:uncharacterized lipoprotein YbaY
MVSAVIQVLGRLVFVKHAEAPIGNETGTGFAAQNKPLITA